MKHTQLVKSACAVAVTLALSPVMAQDSADGADDTEEKSSFEQIIVTGTRSSSMTVMESSIAVTALDKRKVIEKSAPLHCGCIGNGTGLCGGRHRW